MGYDMRQTDVTLPVGIYLGITFFLFVLFQISPYFSHLVYSRLCLEFKYCTYLVLLDNDVEESQWAKGRSFIVNMNNNKRIDK